MVKYTKNGKTIYLSKDKFSALIVQLKLESEKRRKQGK